MTKTLFGWNTDLASCSTLGFVTPEVDRAA